MQRQIEYAVNHLNEIKGELTAAVLIIPVSLAFQDLAHALFGNTALIGVLAWSALQLASLLFLAVLNVTILSLGILHLQTLNGRERGILALSLLLFVGAVAIAGGLATNDQSVAVAMRLVLLASFISIFLVSSFFHWENADSEWWIILADLCGLFCILTLVLTPMPV